MKLENTADDLSAETDSTGDAQGGERVTLDRRAFVKLAAALAATGGAGAALAQNPQGQPANAITPEMLAEAEKIAGLEFTDEERQQIARGLARNLRSYQTIRDLKMANGVQPSVQFHAPLGGTGHLLETMIKERGGDWPARQTIEVTGAAGDVPAEDEAIAFMKVAELAPLLKSRKLSPVRLTDIYLERLNRLGPGLECVVTMMDDRARAEARRAESEINAGEYRGPLHGIPWGAKDLLSTRGVRTTWGAKPYENQMFDEDAAVVTRLREAGAILLAKLTLGALAQGDRWFGGRTRNPWNPEQGSSGSSAGPASATAAGLVGFAIGTETQGSIVSPSRRCGVSGLRPTFGRVSRAGAMALSWSMDKLGPMCRSIEDCALVFNEIHGADGIDITLVTMPFEWKSEVDLSELRIGYVASEFEPRGGGRGQRRGGRGGAARGGRGGRGGNAANQARQAETLRLNRAVLDQFRALGADLNPIGLPGGTNGASIVLAIESAAAFDELTRSNRDDLMEASRSTWPNTFRTNRFVPAVEYIQAQRARTLLMHEMAESMADFDMFISPGGQLGLTNLTGHPAVVFPVGFIEGSPIAVTLVGGLYKDDLICAAAHQYQKATDFNDRRPALG